MEHLFLKILPFVSLAALTQSGTALVSAAPAQAQGRGGYTQIDGDDDFDTPRVPRRILGDDLPRARSRGVVGDGDEDTRIEWRVIERRVTERRVVAPVVERRVIEHRPVVAPSSSGLWSELRYVPSCSRWSMRPLPR
jgi:hypothetical protein